ncbi:MAG: hypothetical protein NVS1B10_03280 [Candidatus Saccharimonadales bacterium]
MQSFQEMFGVPKAQNPPKSSITVGGAPTYASINTSICIWPNILESIGRDITYLTDPALGGRFLINTDGTYGMTFNTNSQGGQLGIVQDLPGLPPVAHNGDLRVLPTINQLASVYNPTANQPILVNTQAFLKAGTVIWPHGDTSANGTLTNVFQFRITRLG